MTVRPPQKKDVVLANDKIKFDRVQLINHLGENQGVVSRREALQAAQYEKKKQQMEARKKQHVIQVKELKIRPKIAEHDYLTKMRQGATFLQEGKHLKITLVFRGREATMKSEQGPAFFARVDATLGAVDFAGKSVAIESDAQTDNLWSRVYILKK